MTTIKRRVAAVSAPVLLALSLTACGGGAGDDAPSDASQEEFCTTYSKIVTLEDGKAIKDWAGDMADVGTPDGISDDQRKGFEVLVNELSDIDDDATAEDVADIEVSSDDKDVAEDFSGWAAETCKDAMADAMGVEMPDLSDVPVPE